jgi:YgiT-type zinc finger domain-containing protein
MPNAPGGTICPICGGALIDGTTTFSVTIDSEVITIDEVPGQICTVCGDAVFTDPTVEWLEKEVKKRRQKIAAEHLAALGGTAPDIKPIRRRRPMGEQNG